MKRNEFLKKWNEITKIKCFEIPVTDKRTNESDYIIFDISTDGETFCAEHVGLTKEQEESKKVAFVSTDIGLDFSIDENLQELYSACIDAILESDFFELKEEE